MYKQIKGNVGIVIQIKRRIVFLTQVCLSMVNVTNALLLLLKKIQHKFVCCGGGCYLLYISAYLRGLGRIFTSFQLAHSLLCFPPSSLPQLNFNPKPVELS